MERPAIDVELTAEERRLILRYGFPFAQIKAAILAVSASKDIEVVELDERELDLLLSDLSRSIRQELGGPRVERKLCDLLARLEYVLTTGDGELDIF